MKGFAGLTPERRREISRKGGIAAHAKGKARTWTSEQAREAGRKGGKAAAGKLPQESCRPVSGFSHLRLPSGRVATEYVNNSGQVRYVMQGTDDEIDALDVLELAKFAKRMLQSMVLVYPYPEFFKKED